MPQTYQQGLNFESDIISLVVLFQLTQMLKIYTLYLINWFNVQTLPLPARLKTGIVSTHVSLLCTYTCVCIYLYKYLSCALIFFLIS